MIDAARRLLLGDGDGVLHHLGRLALRARAR